MATRRAPKDDLSRHPRPSLAVDLVVTSVDAHERLVVLLVKRREPPFAGAWSLPGGFVHAGESVPVAAARVLAEKTGLARVDVEELGSYSAPKRDPRGWVVSIAHLALVPADRLDRVRAGDAAEDARFFVATAEGDGFTLGPRSENDPPRVTPLAFDHAEILAAGLARLRKRVETSPLAFGLLPARFTLGEAQRVVEAIVGRRLDKAAFRTKVLTLGLVRPTTEERRGGAHRPARLYVAAPGWDAVTPRSAK